MDPLMKARLYEQGGRVMSALIRIVMTRPPKQTPQQATTAASSHETVTKVSTVAPPPQTARIASELVPAPLLPTREETTTELKRRLARELYKAELDLAGGLRIAGKSCDCMDHKHTLFLEAAAEELVSQEPSNAVYLEIIQWVKENQPKLTVEAINSGEYTGQYPQMAYQFKDFRKRVMGTTAFNAPGEPAKTIGLEDAKKLAAQEAEREVERRWVSQEKK